MKRVIQFGAGVLTLIFSLMVVGHLTRMTALLEAYGVFDK